MRQSDSSGKNTNGAGLVFPEMYRNLSNIISSFPLYLFCGVPEPLSIMAKILKRLNNK